jgi:hypothetical protein
VLCELLMRMGSFGQEHRPLYTVFSHSLCIKESGTNLNFQHFFDFNIPTSRNAGAGIGPEFKLFLDFLSA